MAFSDKPLNLLVVEDNDGDFILFDAYLQQTNIKVESLDRAETLQEATKQKKYPDVIFLDLSLPDSGGVESFKWLNRLYTNVPIVVLSGLASEEVALECLSLGAQDYLVKNDLTERLLEKSVQYSIERKRKIEEIRDINQQYEMIASVTNEIIWNWNLKTNEVTPVKKQFFDYKEEEIGKMVDWWVDKIHPDDVDKVAKAMQLILSGEVKSIQEEYRFRCADGNYLNIFNRCIVVHDSNGNPQKAIGAIMDITERKKLQEDLLRSQLQFQRQITEATILGQEKEKEKIGKELHDNINQILASTKLYLEMEMKNKNENNEILERCRKNLTVAMDEIRSLSHSLIPPSLGDHGVIEAITELLEEYKVVGAFNFQFTYQDFTNTLLDKDKNTMLYRIVQEQLSNIIKHSKATEVKIALRREGKYSVLSIVDNGIGFNTKPSSKGIGLRNIESRAAFYNGHINLISTPGNGVCMEVFVPV